MFSSITFSSLLLLLCYDILSNEQLSRFIATTLTGLLLSQNNSCFILTLKPIIVLGDVSYSIYLVHWPIFSLHRYCYPEGYGIQKPQAPFADGLCLLLLSIGIGYILEKSFTILLKMIKTWRTLLEVIVGQYFCLILIILLLFQNDQNIFVS